MCIFCRATLEEKLVSKISSISRKTCKSSIGRISNIDIERKRSLTGTEHAGQEQVQDALGKVGSRPTVQTLHSGTIFWPEKSQVN